MRHAEGAGQPPRVSPAHSSAGDREPGHADRDERRRAVVAHHRGMPMPEHGEPGLEDADVDALEAQIIKDHFVGEQERLQAQNARRRLQDRAWLDEVTALGFTGPLLEVYGKNFALLRGRGDNGMDPHRADHRTMQGRRPAAALQRIRARPVVS